MKYFLLFSFIILLILPTTIVGQLYINEVMPANNSSIKDNAGEYDDWFEVYNSSNSAIDIAGYYFTDDLANTTKWQVPSTNAGKTTIPANGYKIFWADDDETQGEDHLNFKLSGGGDLIYLYKPNGTTIEDGLTFPALADDQSYGRNTDGNSLLVSFTQSTPNFANSGGIPLVAQPVISPVSGVYTANQTITITSNTPGTNIYFTTDGSEPNQNSTYYNGPFSVGSSVSIRAIAIKAGYSNSDISTASYIYYNTDLPIISISTKPANLWNNNSGMYVVGTNGIGGNCMPVPANFNQDWERAANIIMIETDGSLAFNTNAGISISGGCSRRSPQKSLNIAAKSVFGSSNFKHQIFPDYEQDKFKRFKLRNGGNDFNGFALRDVICQSVIEGEVDIDQQRSRASVVFMNGEYWGIMNIRDNFSEHWIKENHKIADKDSIDLLAPAGINKYARVSEGSANDYISLFEYIESNNLSNQSNYNYVQSKIDINEYINYWIVQLYMANTDWPGNNVKIWKEQLPNAKFRWLLFDTDWTLGYTRNYITNNNNTTNADVTKNMLSFATNTANSGWPNDRASTLIFRKLLQNTSFKNEFIQRMATQMDVLFEANRCQAIADSRYNEIINEKQAHFNRWKNEIEDGTNNTMHRLNITDWQTEYDYVRNWFSERKPHMENHIKSHFNIGGMYTLSILVNSNTNGSVLLNENEYKAPFNYSAKYFDDIPLRIRAVPAPGYRFSHWKENNSTNEIEIISTSIGKSRTPVFETAKELVINEIFYNPSGSSESTEFIEIYNPDSKAKSLAGYYFDDGICFEFPKNASIAAGEYIVLAKYASIYTGNGYQVFQWNDSSLSNDGELLVFMNPAKQVIDSVEYNDNTDWPQDADGNGYSLALLNDALDNYQPTAWQRQETAHPVTPGEENRFCTPIAANPLTANVTCQGLSDGFISVSASGGTGPYTYLWDTGQTSNTITNLSAGTYSLVIKDALLCEHTETINMTQPAALSVSFSATDETYFQANDGSVMTNATGGTPPYTYSWSNGSTTSNQNNLAPGSYTLTLTDAFNCSITKSIEIDAIDCSNINLSVQSTDESYFQNNDGTAEAIGSGGSLPYTYSWSNGSNTATVNNLSAGTYTVDITDAVGCSLSETVNINAITCNTLNANISSTNETFFQANDGTAEVVVSGGETPYTYSWSNGSNTATVNNLSAGTYTVDITDVVGCSLSETININAITCNTINANISSTNETFFQANDGTAEVVVSGGETPYTYNWSNGSNTATVNNLSPGTYTVDITDAVGCSLSETVNINGITCNTLNANISSTNETFFQANDGTAEVVVSGGETPYTYNWSNGSNTATVNNLSPGTYTVDITDAVGCSLSETVNINAITCNTLNANISSTNETFFQANDGTAEVVVSGGETPYTYSWSNGSNTATVNNLSPGTYTVDITDVVGCSLSETVNINAITCNTLNANISSTNETFFQANDGTAEVVVSGGETPYTYNWSNGLNAAAITDLVAGSYSVQITDAVGCVLTETTTINSIDCGAVSLSISKTDETYYQISDGTAEAIFSGGTTPYSYNWSSGGNASVENNLAPGSYSVTVSDDKGCSLIESFIIEAIDCSSLNIEIAKTDETYYQINDGTASAIVSGGVAPYSYNWSNGATITTINNLSPASYTVMVTDAVGCPVNQSININAITCNSFNIQMNKTDESYYQANDGTAQVTVSGGISPYSYSWSNGTNTNTNNMLSPATYTVEVTDAVGCMLTESISINALTCTVIEVDVTQQAESCYSASDGSINIANISNGRAPYATNWSNGSTATTLNNLTQGDYTLTITDANGCPFTENYAVTGPTAITTDQTITPASDFTQFDGSIDLSVQGGVPPYQFYWSTGAITEDIDNLLASNYWVSITDANNCSVFISTLTVDAGNCMPTFTQMNNPSISSGTTQVVDYIISNGNLNTGSTVTFKAGNYIHLINDFEVTIGAEFEAVIEDCE